MRLWNSSELPSTGQKRWDIIIGNKDGCCLSSETEMEWNVE